MYFKLGNFVAMCGFFQKCPFSNVMADLIGQLGMTVTRKCYLWLIYNFSGRE
jgi:hypothetical protein